MSPLLTVASPLWLEVLEIPIDVRCAPGVTAVLAALVLFVALAARRGAGPARGAAALGGAKLPPGVSPGGAAPGGAAPGGASEDDDPASRWAGQYGRFKSCGLRPDPLADDVGLPEYSLENLDLSLGDLDPDAKAALADLGQRVADLAGRTRTDASTLQRYLRARKGNVPAAERYFRAAFEWRQARGVERCLVEWNLEVYERCLAPWWLSGGLLGHGLRGEQVGYERMARCNWPRLMNIMPWEHIEKIDIVHCMRSLAALEEDCLRTGMPMGGGLLVIDCQGFTWDQGTMRAAKGLSALVEIRSKIMPECISKVFLVNAPAALVYAWGMCKYVFDRGVAEKVQVAGRADTLALLRRHIANDQIPGFLGGGFCADGDPQCRRILAPGGPLPEEVLQRFLHLARRPRQDAAGAGAAFSVGDFPLTPMSASESKRGGACGMCGACPQQ